MSADSLLVRHCSFQAFVSTCPCDEDFDFTVVKALNGAAGAVSFRSTNFNTKYLAAVSSGAPEKNRVTLQQGGANKDAASWMPVAGLSDPSKFSFKSLSQVPAVAGGYMTASAKATGTCAGGPNKGDVLVTKTPKSKAAATWESHKHPPPPPRPPPPPPPKSPWGEFSSNGAVGTASIVSSEKFHGKSSLSISMTSNAGMLGMSNRGLGHEGLVFEAG
eukprot:SAG31_NODE_16682_length_700_cov_0.976705_1_plen_217_part_01